MWSVHMWFLSPCTSVGQNWFNPCTAELYTVGSLFLLSSINRMQKNDRWTTGQCHLSNDALTGDSAKGSSLKERSNHRMLKRSLLSPEQGMFSQSIPVLNVHHLSPVQLQLSPQGLQVTPSGTSCKAHRVKPWSPPCHRVGRLTSSMTLMGVGSLPPEFNSN